MTIRLTEHKTLHHQRVIALVLIIIAAAIVGYFAIASMYLKEQPIVVETPQSVEVDEAVGNTLYFSAAERGQDEVITYAYNLNLNEWRPILNYPGHFGYSPMDNNLAFVTMPNIDIDVNEISATNAMLPAYFDTATDEFTYLDTPDGFSESHYRLAPTQNGAVAYMQRTDENSDPLSPDSWQVVVHRAEPLENIVIEGAAYPEWLSPTELAFLRVDGLYMHDITTGRELWFDLPFYEEFSLANQYSFGPATASSSQTLLLTATEEDGFSLLEMVPSYSDEIVPTFDEVISGVGPSSIFTDPIASPDLTQLAVVSQQDSEVDSSNQIATIKVYNFSTLEEEILIPLDLYEPGTVRLLGWK